MKDSRVKEELKSKFIAQMFEGGKVSAIGYIELYLKGLDPEKREQAVEEMLENYEPILTMLYLEAWIEHIPEEKRKAILRELILQEEFRFIYHFNEEIVLTKYFTKEEIYELLLRKIQTNCEDLFDSYYPLIEFLGGTAQTKKFISENLHQISKEILKSTEKMARLFTQKEFSEIMDQIMSTHKGRKNLMDTIEYWGEGLSYKYAWDTIKKVMDIQPEDVIANIENVKKFIPSKEKKDFALKLVRYTPAVAIYGLTILQELHPDLSEEEITKIALEDTEKLALAPKTLSSLWKDIQEEEDEKREQAATQAAIVYNRISKIQQQNLQEACLHILDQASLSIEEEQTLIAIASGFAALNIDNPQPIEGNALGNSLSEAQAILFKKLADTLELKEPPSEAQSKNFMQIMGSPAPFLSYFIQHKDSAEHKAILKELFENILEGKDQSWKYGAGNEESLNKLKSQKLLPANLTLEQHRQWRKDDQTSLFESLAAGADELSKKIKELLINNENLKVEALQASKTEKLEENLQAAIKDFAEIGPKRGKIGKRIGQLKRNKSRSPSEEEELKDLIEQASEMNQEKEDILLNIEFLRLALVNKEELAQGVLLKDEETKKKGKKITNILSSLDRRTQGEANDVIKNIILLYEDFTGGTTEKQNLSCTDTGDSKVTLEIGQIPVPSCQNYEFGEYNECLLSYFDCDSKIIILKNEKGNLIARSVLRLKPDKQGDPGLHLERIYSTSASKNVRKLIFAQAFEKAKKMGIPLYINKKIKNESGEMVDQEKVENFEFKNTETILISKNSRAPLSYVDSAGGKQRRGRYKLKDLVEVQATA